MSTSLFFSLPAALNLKTLMNLKSIKLSSEKSRCLFLQALNPPILIFVQSKDRAKQLFEELRFEKVKVDVIHADKTDAQREDALDKFRSGKVWALICSDVASRGIDFKGVNCVINYDFPQSTSAYIHRIGRSGRAGRTGEAITFYTEEDAPLLKSIANVMIASGGSVPEWMMQLKKQRMRGFRKLHVPRREDICTLPPQERKRNWRKKPQIVTESGAVSK